MSSSSQLHQLIASGDLDQAMEVLLAHTEGTARHSVAIQIASRFNTLKSNELKGIISFENARLERSQITHDLLNLLETNIVETLQVPGALQSQGWRWKKTGTWIVAAIGILAGLAEFSGFGLHDIFLGKKSATEDAFSLTVFVHGKGGKQDMVLRQQGEVVIDFPGGERRTAHIHENGEALFQNLPASFQGKKVRLNVDFSEPYRSLFPDSLYDLRPDEQIYLPVALLGLDKVAGTVIWRNAPLPGVMVSIGTFVSDTTDVSGSYELRIPESVQKKEQEVRFFKDGYKILLKSKFPQDGEPLNVTMEKIK